MTLRFLALFLAFLLPLQFAWGAAAAYCQHETAPSLAAHFGHHEHAHKGGVKAPADGKWHIDADCGFCNAGAPHAVTSQKPEVPTLPFVSHVDVLPTADISSVPARAPDRPQWPRLA